MLLKRHFERLLLKPSDLKPSHDDFEVVGVFNPGAILAGDEVILLVRVAERRASGGPASRPRRGGCPAKARRSTGCRTTRSRCSIRGSSSRRPTAWCGSRSSRTCGWSDAATADRSRECLERPFLFPTRRWRSSASRTRGSRRSAAGITSRMSPSRATARRRPWHPPPTSANSNGTGSSSVRRTRTWSCSRRRSAGSTSHSTGPNAATPFCRPEMWVARSPDLIHWGRHECLHGGGAEWETGRVGAGTPPVRVDDGWLEIYHGNRQPTRPGEVGMYSTGVFLLDGDNPSKILRRTAASVFEPTADFERDRLRARCGVPHGDRRDRRLIPGLLRGGRFVHGGGRVFEGRSSCDVIGVIRSPGILSRRSVALRERLLAVDDRRTGRGHLRFRSTKSRHRSGTLSSWKIASTGHSGRHASQSMHSSGAMNNI